MMRMVPLLIVLFLFAMLGLAGCAPRSVTHARAEISLPGSAAVTPGQSLTLRLEDGGTAIVTTGKPYISALGEACVRITGSRSLGTACLRDGEWIGLPDIFISRPDEGARP